MLYKTVHTAERHEETDAGTLTWHLSLMESVHDTSLNISYTTFYTCVSTSRAVSLSMCDSSAE